MDKRSTSTNRGRDARPPWLRRADQAAIAVLATAAALLLVVAVFLRGRQTQGLIEIDMAAPIAIDFRTDLNQAGWPELALLPGVGEALARRIVESRQRDGPFRQARDLLRVPGIGAVKLDAITPYLTPFPDGGDAEPTAALSPGGDDPAG